MGEEFDNRYLTAVCRPEVGKLDAGRATADDGGLASVDIRYDGLSEGRYAVTATGDGGSEANAALLVAVSNPALQIHLLRNTFSADLPIATTVMLTGFLEGESVEVVLEASDGSSMGLGTVTARGRDGLASVDFRHDGLAAGIYAVLAIGDGGSKASYPLFVK